MLNKVRRTIEKYNLLAKGDRVLVGVSGGPDSMALLHVLRSLSKESKWELVVSHVEHGLRGEESLADAEFVRSMASQWEIPFIMTQPKVKAYAAEKGISTQVAARELRYQAFRETALSTGATKIALAHHADDQAETVLLRILRGTSISGLSGIPIRRKFSNIEIVRPLYEVGREEIEEYCITNKVPYRIDSSNASIKYLRNKIRLQLLPLLEREFNENIKKALVQLGELASYEDDFMQNQAMTLMEAVVVSQTQAKITVDVNSLLGAHVALQRRVITLILYYLCGHTKEWENKHIELILELAKSRNPSAQIDLSADLVCRREYTYLHIGMKQSYQKTVGVSEILLQVPDYSNDSTSFEFTLPEYGLKGSMEVLEGRVLAANEWEAVFDFESVQGQVFKIRPRSPGDVIKLLGTGGTKKVKELFIEARIPREERTNWAIWTLRNQIAWIPGIRRGNIAAISSNTQHTLRIRVERYHSGGDTKTRG